MRLWSRASARTSSRPGATEGVSAATAIEDPLHLLDAHAPLAEQDEQVVEHVGRLLRHPLGRLAGGSPGQLVGLLSHLLADALGVVEQRGRVGALGTLGLTRGDGALQAGKRLMRGRWLQLAP